MERWLVSTIEAGAEFKIKNEKFGTSAPRLRKLILNFEF